MRVLVTGSSGFIGSAISSALETRGDTVVRLVRRPNATDPSWDPEAGVLDAQDLEGMDAVVHLAGASVGKRWTRTWKERIRRSRVGSTSLLASALARLETPPAVFLSASAIGYYGDRADELLTEASPSGEGFRAQLCREWEAATDAALNSGTRVVQLRSAHVLGMRGGILPFLVAPTRFRIALRLGHGNQFDSWISIDDVIRAILHLISDHAVHGPVNLTAPEPVRQSDFAATLASLRKPSFICPVPEAVLGAVLGHERAQEVVLSSQRAVPARLIASGFSFLHPNIRSCLCAALNADPSAR